MSGTYIRYPATGGSGPVQGTSVLSTGVSANLVLTAQGDGTSNWGSVAGTGDVVGPGSATANGLARFNGVTGKLIKDTGTGCTMSDGGTLTVGQLIDSGLTASKPVFTDSSKQLTSTGTVPVANGGTNSTTSLNNNRVMVSSSGSIVEASAITAARVLISDANGVPTHSTVTSATLALLAPSEYDAGNSSTAITLDWTNGTAQKVTLTGSVTFTLSNPVTGTSYVIRIATGAGSFTATWPGTVKWSGGTAPTITATASKVDLINLYWDGTSYYGSYAQNY